MHKFKLFTYISLLGLCMPLISCTKPTPPVVTLTEGFEKLDNLLTEEYKINVKVYPIENTLYLYAPLREGIYDFQASPSKPPAAGQYKKVFEVNEAESFFEDSNFHVEYDIGHNRSYPIDDPGYTTTYSQPYQLLQQKLYQALGRSFGDLNGKHGRDNGPEFVVIYMVDISSGLYVKSEFVFADYQKSQAYALPQSELKLRTLYELKGNKDLVGDETGATFEYKPITWTGFLARQIRNRIKQTVPKETDFTKDIKDIVLQQVYNTLNAYEFKNYESIELRDLRLESVETLQKEELEKYKTKEPNDEKGKLYNIRFDYDKEKGVSISEMKESFTDEAPKPMKLTDDNLSSDLSEKAIKDADEEGFISFDKNK